MSLHQLTKGALRATLHIFTEQFPIFHIERSLKPYINQAPIYQFPPIPQTGQFFLASPSILGLPAFTLSPSGAQDKPSACELVSLAALTSDLRSQTAFPALPPKSPIP